MRFSSSKVIKQPLNDGERIHAAGAPVVQINTGSGCHLDADMVAGGVGELKPSVGSVVMIENVGNLICPALFDLGERAKVAILSVTEGEDKPLKYPHMFQASQVVLLNKIDLLPHLEFDLDRCIANARKVNSKIEVIQVSATTGEGLKSWYEWIHAEWQEGARSSLRLGGATDVILSILSLGFLMGMRHALEADHVAAVASIASHRQGIRAISRHGVFWGLGHTLTLLLVGGTAILLKVAIDDRLATALEFTVGIMLTILGVARLVVPVAGPSPLSCPSP